MEKVGFKPNKKDYIKEENTNFEPPATDDEIKAVSFQYSGELVGQGLVESSMPQVSMMIDCIDIVSDDQGTVIRVLRKM